MKNKLYLVIAAALIVSAIALVIGMFGSGPNQKQYKVAVPPFVDTAITVYGEENGIFDKYGLDVDLVAVEWERQYDLLTGGALDISMSTLSEFVNKDKNLRRADRRVVYLLPAWQFLGLGFYTNSNFKTLEQFEAETSSAEALIQFSDQLRGNIVVVPEGSVFETALLKFLDNVGMSVDDIRLINASLDSAINSLNDDNVALVAVGSQQRFEAERRGFVEAIAPDKLGAVILTGFVVREELYTDDREALNKFACAWYETLNAVENSEDKGYSVIESYLQSTGAGTLTMDEYLALRQYNDFALSFSDAREKFLDDPDGGAWQRVWGLAVESLLKSDTPEAAPEDQTGFVADSVLNLTPETCASFLQVE